MEGLSLVEEEEEGLVFDLEGNQGRTNDLELCLIARFLTDKRIHTNTMKNRLPRVWHPGKEVSIKEVETGLFVFQFFHKLDLQRVFSCGPWTFDNHMLILERVHAGDVLCQIPLSHAILWFQVHDLPIGFISPIIGQHLGNFISEFIEYDANNYQGVLMAYMHIE